MFDVYSSMRSVQLGGVEVTYADHGHEADPAVLLIHGFPDSARLWRHQIPALVDSGYRVLAPDLRGFGRSGKPTDVDAYNMSVLGSDMQAVLAASGVEQAHVVGHDWGGAVAWYLAIASPNVVRSLTALSVGHPSAFRSAGFRQLEKSWYMLLFQFEDVAESWLSADDWRGLRTWTGSPSEIEHWIEDLSKPGALTAALGIYRANSGPERFTKPLRRLPAVSAPVMGVWSTGDMALLESQMTASEAHVAGEWRYERIEDASHWIPVDAPERLNELLLDWLAGH